MKQILLSLGVLFYTVLPAFGAAYTLPERMQEASNLYFTGHPKDALSKYIAITKENGHREAFLNAVFIAMEQNLPKEAVDIALEAHHLYPQDDEVIEMAAEALLADGQYASAERMLSFLHEDNQTAGFFYVNLARAQLGLDEDDLAEFNLQQAVKAGSHPGIANFLLGQVYERKKDFEQAADAYKKVLDYDHQFIEARIKYAHMLEKIKDYNEAYRQYKILYVTDKKNTRVADDLARLKPHLTKPEKELSRTVELPEHTAVQALVLPPGTQDVREIKIGLGTQADGRPSPCTEITFSPSHAFTIRNDQGKEIATGKAGETWKAILEKDHPYLLNAKGKQISFQKSVTMMPLPSENPTQAPTFLLKHLLNGPGMTWASISDKEYRGKLQILYSPGRHTLIPINVLSLEEYIQGIIASEMPAAFPKEALRAQAVLARTYALKHLGKHKAYGYDLCDTQNCQVYGGVTTESEPGNAAVESTLGQILQYKDKPIESVFSANCGGATQSAKDAGWTDTPYLQTVSDYKEFDFDKLEPYHFQALLQYPSAAYSKYNKHVSMAAFRWARVVSEKELQDVIKNQKRDIGQITALIPLQRSRAGYVTKLLVKGSKGSVTLNKENVIRNNLSLGTLRSSYFIVQPNYEKRQLKYFVFYGGGWGHGVGFCQTGAAGRAEAGQDYKTILQHYFPLAELKTED